MRGRFELSASFEATVLGRDEMGMTLIGAGSDASVCLAGAIPSHQNPQLSMPVKARHEAWRLESISLNISGCPRQELSLYNAIIARVPLAHMAGFETVILRLTDDVLVIQVSRGECL